MTAESLVQNWHIWLVCALMIVGAVIDGWILKVPNWLTHSMNVGAWVYWLVVGIQRSLATAPDNVSFAGRCWLAVQGMDRFGLSFLGSLVAGIVLFLMYRRGMMGGGDVKLYAGFGAWMVPIDWFGFEGLAKAFAVSVIVGGIMGLAIMIFDGTLKKNIANTRQMLLELQTLPREEVRKRALERKPKMQLLPYGIPLTIGSLGYLAYMPFH